MSNSIVLPKSAISMVKDSPGVFEIDLGELCIRDLRVEVTTNSNGTSYLNFNEENEPKFSLNRNVVQFKKDRDLPLTNKIRFNFHNDLKYIFNTISDTAKITLLFYDENNHQFLKDVRKGIDFIYDKPLTYPLTANSIGSVELVDVNSLTDEQIDVYKNHSKIADVKTERNFNDFEDASQGQINDTSISAEELNKNLDDYDLHNSQKHPSENVHLNKSTDTFNDDQTITFRRDYSYLENRFNNKNSQNKTEEKKGIFSWLKNLF